MTDVAVQVTNVSKRFKLYHNTITGPVKEFLFPWQRERYFKEFLAVKDVSLEIKRGEVVGIIGPNGAGKTTLLKMIAGLLPVDKGQLAVNGKITALLALGVGVHPEFTGRENILYGGMLLGMSKAEVQRKLDGIIEFSELGDYIDRPFRTYSSGMKARLLFATSMSIDPDILIVDEALATGDAAFVHKSSHRIKEVVRSGATILFVSHNLRQIEELCPRCIVMQKGSLLFDGPTEQAVPFYVESVYQAQAKSLTQNAARQVGKRPFQGTGEIQVEEMYFVADGQRTETVKIGEACELHIDYEAQHDLDEATVCVEVYTHKSPVTFAFLPTFEYFVEASPQSTFAVKAGKGKLVINFAKLVAGDGVYGCNVEFYPGRKDYRFTFESCYCFYERICSFQAVYPDSSFFGRGTLTEMPVKSLEIRPR